MIRGTVLAWLNRWAPWLILAFVALVLGAAAWHVTHPKDPRDDVPTRRDQLPGELRR